MKRIYLLPYLIFSISVLSSCADASLQTPIEPVFPTQTFAPPTTTPAPTETAIPPTAEIATELPAVTEAVTTSGVSFANDVAPIFTNSCNKCHGVEQVKEGLDLRSYESLMTGSFNGAVLTPGDSANSLLVQQLIDGEMPKRGSKLTPEQIQIISDWVNQGAVNN